MQSRFYTVDHLTILKLHPAMYSSKWRSIRMSCRPVPMVNLPNSTVDKHFTLKSSIMFKCGITGCHRCHVWKIDTGQGMLGSQIGWYQISIESKLQSFFLKNSPTLSDATKISLPKKISQVFVLNLSIFCHLDNPFKDSSFSSPSSYWERSSFSSPRPTSMRIGKLPSSLEPARLKIQGLGRITRQRLKPLRNT